MNPLALSALQLSRELKARRISPVELMQLTLEKAKKLNEEYSAFITIAGEQALAQAREVEQAFASGRELPVCAGIPVSVKDTEDTAGIRTTYGSPIYRSHVPEEDGAAASNLRRSGAIIFAKSNMPSFAHSDMGNNLLGPPARNPHMPTHTSGGSSSGAAIAVAAGLSPFAHGTDGSGSVRIPASLCGVVGFKPSYGRIPLWPVRDLWAARSHNGVLARSVEDAAVGMLALSGRNDFDPLVNTENVDWLAYGKLACVGQLRGAYLEQLGLEAPDEEIAACCRRAVTLLQESGMTINDHRVHTEDTHDWYCDLWQPLFARQLEPFVKACPELVDPTLMAIVERGSAVDIGRFLGAREARSRFHTAFTRQMQSFSYLITPTMPCVAWSLDGAATVRGGRPPKYVGQSTKWESVHFFNILGWPAITVPCGKTRDGRPIGIQIVARKDDDLLCLKIAEVLEQKLATGGRSD
ncbi:MULTISPECIES: amidase [unclassified Bradyrhizobium]|jgi:Asp-tRNA(Asn)/Glu-tRNA(Gln) amidotransferase A subunit family amidase|uniref:amidase n=1 Tax=unclassified Bradyrhizobium TaxID=2631580 RepID=UPI00041B1513|nr:MULTISPECIES: amidase [unclassified Bradyrhizobium]AUC98367.1 amidase [Bradyrhizobium sp. SK17]MBK5652004.1 amidase [Rhizobium sp.]OCX32652.1 hypothetical protein QU42_02590 [Bradyrhizobium sp. UASWS1016]